MNHLDARAGIHDCVLALFLMYQDAEAFLSQDSAYLLGFSESLSTLICAREFLHSYWKCGLSYLSITKAQQCFQFDVAVGLWNHCLALGVLSLHLY